jgi:hypothetical protein
MIKHASCFLGGQQARCQNRLPTSVAGACAAGCVKWSRRVRMFSADSPPVAAGAARLAAEGAWKLSSAPAVGAPGSLPTAAVPGRPACAGAVACLSFPALSNITCK